MVCRMKKLLLCVLLCALLALSVSAAGTQTYDLPEIGLTVEIPEQFLVVTRSDAAATDPTLLSNMLGAYCYLELFDNDNYTILYVYAESSYVADLNDMSATEFASFLKRLRVESGVNKSETFDTSSYYQGDILYATAHYVSAPNEDFSEYYSYLTIIDGVRYCFRLYSWDEPAPQGSLNAFKQIVDSAKFYAPDYDAAAEAEANWTAAVSEAASNADNSGEYERDGPFLFEDETYEFSFPVPSGWFQSIDPDDEPYKFTFYPNSFIGFLTVGIDDYWAAMPTEQQDETAPAEIDLSWFEVDEIADLLGVEAVSAVTVGDNPFYYGEALYSYEDSDESIPVIGYVTAHYGYLYYFLYGGEQDDATADDLTGMLAGLQFTTDTAPEQPAAVEPAVEEAAAAEPAAEAPAEADVPAQLRRFALIGVLAVAVLALAFVLCLVLARRSARKHPCSGSGRYLNGQEVSGDGDCVDRDDYRRRGPDLD